MRPKPCVVTPSTSLSQCDGVEAGPFVDLRRHRVLQQNTVHVGIGIELRDLVEQLGGRGIRAHLDSQRIHADAATGVALHTHVSGRGRIGPDEDRCQDRYAAAGTRFQRAHARGEGRLLRRGQRLAIENACGHTKNSCGERGTKSCARRGWTRGGRRTGVTLPPALVDEICAQGIIGNMAISPRRTVCIHVVLLRSAKRA